jgi:hypothetical protein
MKHYNLNRICDRPLGVTFVAGALCARGNGHNIIAPHWLNAGGGAFYLKEVVTVTRVCKSITLTGLMGLSLGLPSAHDRGAAHPGRPKHAGN